MDEEPRTPDEPPTVEAGDPLGSPEAPGQAEPPPPPPPPPPAQPPPPPQYTPPVAPPPASGDRDAFGNPIAPGQHYGAPAPAPQPAAPPPPVPPPVAPPPVAPPPPPGPPQPQPPGYAPPPPGYVPPPVGYPQPGPAGYPQPLPPAAYQAPKPKGPHGEPMFGEYELASWGQRVGAYLIDALVLVGIFIVGAILAAAGGTGPVVAGVAVMVLGYILYGPLLLARGGERNGQTVGKHAVGIRVIRENGQAIDIGFGLLRQFVVIQLLFGALGGLFFFPPIVDLLWPLWDDQNRALHDMIVSTRVARAR